MSDIMTYDQWRNLYKRSNSPESVAAYANFRKMAGEVEAMPAQKIPGTGSASAPLKVQTDLIPKPAPEVKKPSIVDNAIANAMKPTEPSIKPPIMPASNTVAPRSEFEEGTKLAQSPKHWADYLPTKQSLPPASESEFPGYTKHLKLNGVQDTKQERKNYLAILANEPDDKPKEVAKTPAPVVKVAPPPAPVVKVALPPAPVGVPPKEVEKKVEPVKEKIYEQAAQLTGLADKSGKFDMNKVENIAAQTGKSIVGVLQSVVSGYMAGLLGQQFDPSSTTIAKDVEEKRGIDAEQRRLQDEQELLEQQDTMQDKDKREERTWQEKLGQIDRAFEERQKLSDKDYNTKQAQADREARIREIQVASALRSQESQAGKASQDPYNLYGSK
jgi:hypothetical protein